MEKKGREVELWISKNGIPSWKKLEIMKKLEVELKKNKDVDVQNILSILHRLVMLDGLLITILLFSKLDVLP